MTGRKRESIKKPLVYRISLGQIVFMAPCVLVLWLYSPSFAVAFVAGATIELVSRAYFGYYAFRFVGAQQISLVVGAFRKGELGKFVLVVLLFGMLFITLPDVQPIAVFVGYLVSSLLGTFISFRMLR